jgi:hypothetical protein
MLAAAPQVMIAMRCYRCSRKLLLLLHLCSDALLCMLLLLTFCRSLFTAAAMSQELPWPLEPALVALNSTRCCAAT